MNDFLNIFDVVIRPQLVLAKKRKNEKIKRGWQETRYIFYTILIWRVDQFFFFRDLYVPCPGPVCVGILSRISHDFDHHDWFNFTGTVMIMEAFILL